MGERCFKWIKVGYWWLLYHLNSNSLSITGMRVSFQYTTWRLLRGRSPDKSPSQTALWIPLKYLKLLILAGGFNQPLWKIMEWKSAGMMTFPIWWEKHVPNHQPVLYVKISLKWTLIQAHLLSRDPMNGMNHSRKKGIRSIQIGHFPVCRPSYWGTLTTKLFHVMNWFQDTSGIKFTGKPSLAYILAFH